MEAYLRDGDVIRAPKDLPRELLKEKAAVFVSLHKKKGHALKGCLGTFLPVERNIANEIIRNSVLLLDEDRRSQNLEYEDLESLEIIIDILSDLELVKKAEDLAPRHYGIVIRTPDERVGVVLPDLEGVSTVRQQVKLACEKEDIDPDEDYSVYRFEVERHRETIDH